MTPATTSPLGRDSMQFEEAMKKYHGEIERLIYAAEINCPLSGTLLNFFAPKCDHQCAFNPYGECRIPILRKMIGDHVIQHDTEVRK